jgi:ABC-type polysaccharide/polyol phosphate transport system ATPase subunit
MASIELRNVSVEFPLYNVNARMLKKSFVRLATGGSVFKDTNQHVLVRSLNNVTLSLQHGDRIGLIGHNGAGKSTMLRLLAKIYEPTYGQIKIEGHISSMLDLIQGMEPESSGYENIFLRGIILGLKRKEIKKQIDQISDLTGLGDFLHMPIRTYSSGMLARLAFAISTSINPEILLIDEVFGVGDAEFIKKAEERMIYLLNQSSIVVLASHSEDIIRQFCNKAAVMEHGALKYVGPVEDAFRYYSDNLS